MSVVDTEMMMRFIENTRFGSPRYDYSINQYVLMSALKVVEQEVIAAYREELLKPFEELTERYIANGPFWFKHSANPIQDIRDLIAKAREP